MRESGWCSRSCRRLPPAFVDVAVGVMMLRLVDPVYVQLGVGVVVAFSALLLLREIRLPGAETWWGPVVAGSACSAIILRTGGCEPGMRWLAKRDTRARR